jgi:hypothetical protein
MHPLTAPPARLTLSKLSSTNLRIKLVLPHFAFPTTSSLHVPTMRPLSAAACSEVDGWTGRCFCMVTSHHGARQAHPKQIGPSRRRFRACEARTLVSTHRDHLRGAAVLAADPMGRAGGSGGCGPQRRGGRISRRPQLAALRGSMLGGWRLGSLVLGLLPCLDGGAGCTLLLLRCGQSHGDRGCGFLWAAMAVRRNGDGGWGLCWCISLRGRGRRDSCLLCRPPRWRHSEARPAPPRRRRHAPHPLTTLSKRRSP